MNYFSYLAFLRIVFSIEIHNNNFRLPIRTNNYDYPKPLNFGPGLYWKFSNEARGSDFYHQKRGGLIWPPWLGYQKTKFNLAPNESKMGLDACWKRHRPFEG